MASPVFGVMCMSQTLVAPIRIGRMLNGSPWPGTPRIGIQPMPGMTKSVSGCERSPTQRNDAFRNSAAWPSMLNKPKKIGI
jgi:hypothetical protein